MIKLEVSGVHLDLDSKLKSYVDRKIGKLDRYTPKKARGALAGKVVLTEEVGKSNNRCTCEVILTLPHGVVTAKDSTLNIYAAIDIVEQKVKAQLVKYKSKATEHRIDKRVLRRMRRFVGREAQNNSQ